MKTARYASHTLKTTDGDEITKRIEMEAILEKIYCGLGEFMIYDKLFTVVEDTIKDGKRITILKENQ